MEKSNRTKNTLKNTGFAVAARFISIPVNFVQKTIFLRILGVSYSGISGLFSSILTILSLAELGIGSAIAYSLYKPIAEKDDRRIAQMMNFYKSAYRYIALIVFAVGMCFMPFLDYIVTDVPDIREDIRLIYFLFVFNSSVSYLLIYKNTLLIADQKQHIVTTIQIMSTVVSTVFQCVSLLLFKDYIIFLVLQIVFSIAQNLTINIVATKKYSGLKQYSSEKLSSDDKKRLFADIRALLMYKISDVILGGTDNTIISAFIGTKSVGILGNYSTIKGYVISIFAQFYNSLNPSLGNLAVTQNNSVQHSFFRKLNFATFWFGCFSTCCLLNLINPFIYIWLKDTVWLLPIYTVIVFATEYFVFIMQHPMGAIRVANGLFVQTKYISLIKALLNLIISLLLVKKMGVFGVLIGTIASELLCQCWYEPIVIYRNVFKRSVVEFYLISIKYFATTVFCSAAIYGLVKWCAIQNIYVSFIFNMLLCILIPNAVIWLLFHKSEEYKGTIEMIGNILVKIRNKLHIKQTEENK